MSSARRFEEGGGLSVEGTLGVVSGSLEINVNNSLAFENLNTSVTNLGSSKGIQIVKPGTLRQPSTYAYNFTPYIFGRTKRPGTVDDPTLTGAIQTAGPLQVAFTVNPKMAWWKQAYSQPDVALNHPVRWHFARSDADSFNCLDGQCASLAPKRAENPWLSDFYAMRGFFVTHADASATSSQLRVAMAGEKLKLQARVYKYSLAKMPSSTSVQVRFYAQPINLQNALRDGNSTTLGEAVLKDGIPPFSSANEAPLNSVLASTTFDTSAFAGKYLSFWVVTWMQDANGAIVEEPESHGLTGIPGKLKSLAEVREEPYSNNVGFYKWELFIKPRSGAQTAVSEPNTSSERAASLEPAAAVEEPALDSTEPNSISMAAENSTLAEVQLSDPKLSSSQLQLGQSVVVAADLTAGSSPVDGGAVAFYDGDPKNGGTLFEMEAIPYLPTNGKVQVEVSFEPQACGSHEVFALAFEGTAFEKVGESVVTVHCGSDRHQRLIDEKT